MKLLTTSITAFVNTLIGFITPAFDKNLAPVKIRVQNNKNRS